MTEDGVRIDLPSNGLLRVENQFGNVAVQVWSEREVSIAAVVADGKSLKHSPVVIERTNELLTVKLARAASDPAVAVNLTVRVPAIARIEVITGNGTISSHGLCAAMTLQTGSGNIRAELETTDADIIAQSTAGTVRSEPAVEGRQSAHFFQSSSGSGKRIFRATSQRGEITVGTLAGDERTRVAQRPPELQGASAPVPAAGIPEKQTTTEEVAEGDVIRVDAQLVTLSLSVIDRSTNRGLPGLSETQFKLFEDGAQQRIVHFDSSSAPFDLVLVIDLSGSTREVVKLVRAATRRFIDAARPADRIGIITFAGAPTVVSPLTLDRAALRERAEAIDTLHGDTKLYDAIDFSMAEALREAGASRRSAIVLMSDGLDGRVPGVSGQEGSKLPYAELLNQVREFDGVLYTLWLNTYYEALNPRDTQPEAFDTGHDQMKELAEAGGGIFYEVERLEDLSGAYERVVADLGTVYTLAYRPINKTRDGKWRAIRVSVDRPNALARGKHGYYAN
jgi:VWFA-related protein